MKRGKPILFFVPLLFSLLGLWRFSQGVRTVDIIGLFASGAIAGAVLTGVIVALRAKREP